MLEKIKKFILQMMAGANVATIIIMLAVGFSYRLNPQEHPITSCVGLAFPALLLTNAAFLLLFLLFKKRLALIPALGFIVCYIPVRIYSPLNVPHSTPDDAIKVMSYNVFNFNPTENGLRSIADYINASGASIVCMQEAAFNDEVKQVFGKEYQYMDTARNDKNGEVQLIVSKFPILSKTHINAGLDGCLCAAYEVLVGNDRTTVINCHFECSGLSPADRRDFRNMVKGKLGKDTIGKDSRRMIVQLGDAARRRVPQVEGVIKYIRSRKEEPVLLFGDFNDSPVSYCRSLLAKTLTDCYVATANGPGISYHYNMFYVRIDNVMCSSHWQPFNFKVDRDIAVSDHYPLYGFVKKSRRNGKKSP